MKKYVVTLSEDERKTLWREPIARIAPVYLCSKRTTEDPSSQEARIRQLHEKMPC